MGSRSRVSVGLEKKLRGKDNILYAQPKRSLLLDSP